MLTDEFIGVVDVFKKKHVLTWKKAAWWLNQPILKNVRQIGPFPQVGVKIKNLWNHHLERIYTLPETNTSPPEKQAELAKKETSSSNYQCSVASC